MSDYAALVEFVARSIATDKDAVAVRVQSSARQQVVVIEAADTDMGRLIGVKGRNIEAIRAVVRAAGLRHHQRVQVDLASR